MIPLYVGKALRKILAAGLSFLLIILSLLTPLAQASPFSTISKGPGEELENQEQNGFFNPFKIRERLQSAQSVVREMRKREERQEYLKRKGLMDVLKNVQDIIRNKIVNQEEFEVEMERRKRASASVFGAGGLFNFVAYADGRKVWFKAGQVSRVENERVRDARGNVSLRNMDDMQYDSKGLLVSYRSEVTDSNGIKKQIYWHGATYTEDSRSYGGEGTPYKKLITGYTEEVTDDKGNTAVMDWRGAAYDENDRLSSYHQTSTDAAGNQTSKFWRDGKYDENSNLTSFRETDTDPFGLKTERAWSGGLYEKNPYYVDQKLTPGQSAYNLVGFHEGMTDSRGQTSSRDWRDGRYNEFGELTSYRENSQKTVEGKVLTQEISWSGGTYDEKGHLLSYHQTKKDWDDQSSDIDWADGQYNERGQLVSYNEKTTDADGNLTQRFWQASRDQEYDSKGRLRSYEEEVVDARGNSTRKSWTADEFDRYGRLLSSTEFDVDSEGNKKERHWSTDSTGYDIYGQVLHYYESTVDAFGYKTERTWENGVYDLMGRLVSYTENYTDERGAAYKTVVEGTIYDYLGRRTSYRQTQTDPDGNIEKTIWSGGVYSIKGYLLGYHEEFTNAFGEIQIKDWLASESYYDSFGSLLGYHELVTGFDGIVTERTRSGCEYDHLGRLTRYEESAFTALVIPGPSVIPAEAGIKSSGFPIETPDKDIRGPALGNDGLRNLGTSLLSAVQEALPQAPERISLHTVWEGGTYDSNSRLAGYTQRVTDQNGLTQTKTWQGTYNERGDLRTTNEIFTDETGLTRTTEWNGYSFDNRGRAVSSYQIQIYSDELGVAVMTSVAGRAYDRYGQICGGSESAVTAGTTLKGETFNLTQETVIGNAVFADGAVTGFTQNSHTFGSDPALTWIDNKEERIFSAMSRTGYVEKALQGDHVVTTTRSNIRRDSLGHVLSYTDRIEDLANGPTPTVVNRLTTQFDSFDKPVSSVEHITTPKGEDKFNITANLTQDSRGNSLTYDATTFEYKKGVQSLPENWLSMSAEDQATFLASVQTQYVGASLQVDPENSRINIGLLSIEKRQRLSSRYDSLGRLVATEDKVQSTEDKESRHISWSAQKFDGQNRVASDITITKIYGGETTGEPTQVTESRRSLISYNNLGQVSGNRERATDSRKPNEIVNRELLGITYDTWGTVATQYEVSLTKEFKDEFAVSTKGDLTTESTRSDALFDTLGRLIGYEDSIHQYGVSENGEVIDRHEKRVRKDSRYDDAHPDRILDYSEDVVSSDSPGVLTTVVRQNLAFGLNNQVSEYEEKTTKQGSVIPAKAGIHQAIDLVEVIHRSGIITSAKGNVEKYFEARTSSDKPAESVQTVWEGTYDEKNRLTENHESITISAEGVETEKLNRSRTGITYDSWDRMTGYADSEGCRVRLDNGEFSEEVLTATARTNIQYNTLNQVVAYAEEQSKSNEAKKTVTTWRGGRYDRQGQLDKFEETTRTIGTESSGAPLDITFTDKRLSTKYNSLGQILETADIKNSSDEPDILNYDTSSDITYDEFGRQYSFVQKNHQICPNGATPLDLTVVTTQSSALYDGRGRLESMNQTVGTFGAPIHSEEKTGKTGITYNAWGETMSYKKIQWSSPAPEKTTEVFYQVTAVDAFGRATSSIERNQSGEYWEVAVKENMVWNGVGQIVSYESRTTSSAQSQETKTVWTGTYDSIGRLGAYAETVSDDGSALVTQTRRDQIGYNGLGQMISYAESSLSSAAPDLTTSVSWAAEGYNSSGQLSGYGETKETGGPETRVIETDRKSSITYLRNGLVNGFEEAQWSSKTPNITVTNFRHGTGYDALGRETTFSESELTLAADGSLNVRIDRERLGSKYNAQNQLVGKSERVRSDASPALTTLINWTGSYSERGDLVQTREIDRSLGRDESGRRLDKTTVNVVSGRQFDEFNRLIGERGSFQDGGVTQNRKWSAKGYDAEGRLLSESETIVRTGEGLDVESRSGKDQMVYDDQGRLLGYFETASDSSQATLTAQQMNFTYNGNGQRLTESGEIVKVDSATNGEKLTSLQTHLRDGLMYDTKGRLVAYMDTLQDRSLGVTTTVNQSNTSFNSLGIETGYDQEIRRTSIPEGLIDNTERNTHLVLAFNAEGQTTHSFDSQWSSAAPDRIVGVDTDRITFNTAGQVYSFRRQTQASSQTDPDALSVFEEQIQNSATYDNLGRVIQTTRDQRSTAAMAVTDAITENSTYNDLGERATFSQTDHKFTKDGRLDSYQTQGTTSLYDQFGRTLSETTVGTNSQAPGLITTQQVTNTYGEASLLAESLTELSVTEKTEPLDKSAADQILTSVAFQKLSGEEKTVLTDQLTNGGVINQTVRTTRTGIVYDSSGRALDYTDTKTSSEASGLLTTTHVRGIHFNNLGQEIGYTSEENKSSLTYGLPLNQTSVTTRGGVQYDSLGHLVGYTDTTTDESAVTKTFSLAGATFNDLGLMESKTEVAKSAGMDPVTGLKLNTETETDQSKMVYDKEGRLKGYEEKTTSPGNGASLRRWQALGFNAMGQASAIREYGNSDQEGSWSRDLETLALDSQGRALLTHSSGDSSITGDYNVLLTAVDEDGNIGYNQLGQVTYQKETGFRHGVGNLTRVTESSFNDSYDSLGRQNHVRETQTTDSGTTVSETNSQTYNALGQLIQKSSEIFEIPANGVIPAPFVIPAEAGIHGSPIGTFGDDGTREPQRNTHQDWAATYDEKGRQFGYTIGRDTLILNAEGSKAGSETENLGRSHIGYNDKGQMVDYDETVGKDTFGAAGAFIQSNQSGVAHRNTQYNDLGQITHYEESGTRDGDPFTEDYDATTFASTGEALTWTKSGTDKGKGPYHIDQTGGEVNEKGQFKNYTQNGVSGGQFFTKSDSGIAYDSKGRVKSLSEKGENDGGHYTNNQAYSYDEFGRMKTSSESGTDSQGAYSIDTMNFVYDDKGQAVSKTVVKTDSHGQKTTGQWNGAYDENGRLANTDNSDETVDSAGNQVSTGHQTWTGEYFASGMLKEGRTISTTEKPDGTHETVEQTHTNREAGEDGTFTGTLDRTVTATEFGGVKTSNEVEVEHNNITRYTAEDEKKNSSAHAGRVSGYEEKITQTGTAAPTYNLVKNIEYDENGLEVRQDKAAFNSSIIDKTVDALEGVAGQIFALLKNFFAGLAQNFKNFLEKGTAEKLFPANDVTINLPTAQQILHPSEYSLDLVHRSNGEMDAHGRITKWQETSRSSSAPGKVVTADVEVSYQGAGSEIESYHAVNSEKMGRTTKKTDITQKNYQYAGGRIISYDGSAIESEIDTWRQRETFGRAYKFNDLTQKFDEFGRAIQTKRTTTGDPQAPDLTKVERSDLTYDENGRVTHRHVETKDEGTDQKTGAAINATSFFDEDNTYSASGELSSTHRTIGTFSAPDKTVDTVTNFGNYDEYGRARHTETTSTDRFADGTSSTPETVADDIRSFGPNGQAARLTRTTTRADQPESIKTQELNNVYDTAGRLIRTEGSVKEVKNSADGSLYEHHSYNLVQENLAFNGLGQATRTRQIKSKDEGSQFDYEMSLTEITYGEDGQLKGSVTHNTNRLIGGHLREWDESFTGGEKDARGNFTDFTRVTSKDTDAPAAKTTEVTKGGIYDKEGRLTQYDLNVTNEGISDDGKEFKETKPTVRKFTGYNEIGQVVDMGEWDKDKIDQINNLVKDLTPEIEGLRADDTVAQKDIEDLNTKLDQVVANLNTEEARKNIPLNGELAQLQTWEDDWKAFPQVASLVNSWKEFLSSQEYELAKEMGLYPDLLSAPTHKWNESKEKYEQRVKQFQDDVINFQNQIAQKFFDWVLPRKSSEVKSLKINKEGMRDFLLAWTIVSGGVQRESRNPFQMAFGLSDFKPADPKFLNFWNSILSEPLGKTYKFRLGWHNETVGENGIENLFNNYQWLTFKIESTRNARRAEIAAAKDNIKKEYDKKHEDAAVSFNDRINQKKVGIAVNEALIQSKTDDINGLTANKARMEEEGRTATAKLSYDEYGRVNGRESWDGLTGEPTKDSDFNYNNKGQLTNFHSEYPGSETKKGEDVKQTYAPDGQILSTETDVTETVNELTHTAKVINQIMERDRNGRVSRTRQTVSDSFTDGKTDVRDISYTYDKNNKIKSTTTDLSKVVNGITTHLGTDTCEAKSFDELGRIKDYLKTSREDSSPDVVITLMGHNIYGKNGQLAGTDEVIEKKGTVLNTSQHVVAINTEMKDGRPLAQTRVVDKDSAAPGKTTLDKITFTYDKGLNVTATIERAESSPVMDLHSQTLTDKSEFDNQGRLIFKKTEITLDNFAPDKKVTVTKDTIAYEELGREVGYTETSNEKSTNPKIKLDNSRTITHSNQTYNRDGLLNSFREVEKDVVRNVFGTTYNSQGWMTSQTENRSWNGTGGGHVDGLSDEWKSGSVQLTQKLTYDKYGRISSSSLSGFGGGSNASLAGIAMAGTGGSLAFGGFSLGASGQLVWRGHGGAYSLPLQINCDRTNMEYDAKGRLVKYQQTTTQYARTKETYKGSSGNFFGKKKTKERDVVGLVTTAENVTIDKFNSLGQAINTYSTYSVSNGDYGWSSREDIKYDANGQMVSAVTESWHHTSTVAGGKNIGVDLHSKKEQAFTYDANGNLSETKDIRVDFDRQVVHASKSGNFFASDLGRIAQTVAGVAAGVLLPGWGALLFTLALQTTAMAALGASATQMWQAAAITVAAFALSAGVKTVVKWSGANTTGTILPGASPVVVKTVSIAYGSAVSLGTGALAQKISESSGRSSAAFWGAAVGGLLPGVSPRNDGKGGWVYNELEVSGNYSAGGIVNNLSNSIMKTGLVAIAVNNEKSKVENNWLSASLEGLSSQIVGLLNEVAALGTQQSQTNPAIPNLEERNKSSSANEALGTFLLKIFSLGKFQSDQSGVKKESTSIPSRTQKEIDKTEDVKNTPATPVEVGERILSSAQQNSIGSETNLSNLIPQIISTGLKNTGDTELQKDADGNFVEMGQFNDREAAFKFSPEGQVLQVEIGQNPFGGKDTITFDQKSFKYDSNGNLLSASGKFERETGLGKMITQWKFETKESPAFVKAKDNLLQAASGVEGLKESLEESLKESSGMFEEKSSNGEIRRVFLGKDSQTGVASEHKDSKGNWTLLTYGKPDAKGNVSGEIYRKVGGKYELKGVFVEGSADLSSLKNNLQTVADKIKDPAASRDFKKAIETLAKVHQEKDRQGNITKEIGLDRRGWLAYVFEGEKKSLMVFAGASPQKYQASLGQNGAINIGPDAKNAALPEISSLYMALPFLGEKDAASVTSKSLTVQNDVQSQIAAQAKVLAQKKAPSQLVNENVAANDLKKDLKDQTQYQTPMKPQGFMGKAANFLKNFLFGTVVQLSRIIVKTVNLFVNIPLQIFNSLALHWKVNPSSRETSISPKPVSGNMEKISPSNQNTFALFDRAQTQATFAASAGREGSSAITENLKAEKRGFTASMIKAAKGVYEVFRGGVEIISDIAVSTWEAVAGTAVALGQMIAPALPFIPAVAAALTPIGAAVAAVLLSGSYVALLALKNNPEINKTDFFFNSIGAKIGNAWKGFAVRLSDDFGAFGQKDNKVTIFQSLMNVVGVVPVLGNLVPGPHVHYDVIAALFHTRGIHGNEQDVTKSNGRDLAQYLGGNIGIKAANLDYEFGTFTDVAMSLLNIEHSSSYDMALKFLETGLNEQGKGYILTGHSGGVQRSGYMSMILGSLGYATPMLIGVAGPLGGFVTSNFGNINEIDLLGSSKEDPVSRLAEWLSNTPRDANGNMANRYFEYSGGEFSHQDIGVNPNANPYLLDMEKTLQDYAERNKKEFQVR